MEEPRNMADMYFVHSTWMDRAISVSKNEVESRLPHEYKKTNRRREVFRISVQFTIHNLTSIKSTYPLFIVSSLRREEKCDYYSRFPRVSHWYFDQCSTRSAKEAGMGIFDLWYVVH